MNLLKSLDYFDPCKVRDRIHIIGCGSVGSTLADVLARFGLSNFVLYDFDVVEDKNIANQMFDLRDVGLPKVDALERRLKYINDEIKVHKVAEGWESGANLSGYIFLCVDSIAVRKAIVSECRYNPNIKGIFDIRTGLVEADGFCYDPRGKQSKDWLASTMNFTDEDAKASNPTSACGITLGVATTVRCIVDLVAANFIQFLKTGKLPRTMITINMESMDVVGL